MLEQLRTRARALKAETLALYLALRDPRTPWAARLVGALVVSYALSPIDLIPDFVPVLGYLDDLFIVPAGLWLTLRLVPPEVMADCRARARTEFAAGRPASRAAAVVVILLWIGALALAGGWLWSRLGPH